MAVNQKVKQKVDLFKEKYMKHEDMKEPNMVLEHKHHVHHMEKHEVDGHVHHHKHYSKHAAGHMVHHEHVKKMCGGGYMGKKGK